MFMKTLYTPGVAHLSYIFGDGGQAAVIDPRRDVNEYLEIAHRRGAKMIAGFLLIQLVPYGRSHTNPPMTAEPQWDSPQTRVLAQRACFDCHSNETIWPWYSNVAPMSWLIQRDVDEGRETMNLSEWGASPEISGEGERGQRETDAEEINQVILRGKMPPSQYLILHPEADLSQAERQQLAKGFESMLGLAVK